MKLPATIGQDAYCLQSEIGRGGMAIVYSASVDLDHFDFHQLIARADMSRSESRRIKISSLKSRKLEDAKETKDFIAICDARGIRYPECERVAVKVLEHSSSQQRFEDEWLSLMALQHAHLIRVYGGGHDEELGVDYYVMALIEDALSLEQMIELRLADKLEIIRQAASGLRVLHRSGLIHRDIKPSNLLCSWVDGKIHTWVTDLGIAKDIERSLELTQSRAVIGTPSYMAPEIVRDARQASPRADFYALGATLYHLVCGQAPFEGDSLYNVLSQIISGSPPIPLLTIAPELPRSACELIEKMMAFAPDQRPSSAEQLILDIDTVCAELTKRARQSRPRMVGPTTEPGTPLRTSYRILVADRDEQIRDLLARFLSRANYETEVVGDGAQLLLRLGAGGIDLVIASAQLPVLSGEALVAALRSQGIEVPVLLLVDPVRSGSVPIPHDELVDVVVKPVVLPELVTKLEHIRSLL